MLKKWFLSLIGIREKRVCHFCENIKKTLEKFKKGNTVDSWEELRVLERYASTGMVSFGFDCKLRKATASLTSHGRWFVRQM